MKDLVSRKTRRDFSEAYSGFAVLREIEYDFEDAGLTARELPPSIQISGQRRTLVAQYYQDVDWGDRGQVRKVLDAYEAHLVRLANGGHSEEITHLVHALKRNGFAYREERIVAPWESGLPRERDADHLWEPDHFRLFLSHVSSFKHKTTLLRTELLRYQISGFVAHEDIKPSLEWQIEIKRALQSMDGLAALLTEGFHESDWTDQEVGFALGRDVLVIGILRELDPYGFIGRHQGIAGRGKKIREVARSVFEVLVKNPRTHDRMAEVLARRFATSGSWAMARDNLCLLEEAAPLTAESAQISEVGFYQNSEVHNANGVEERLEALLGKELEFEHAS